MKISDLINSLTQILESDGDLPVYVDSDAADDAGADWSTGEFVVLSALVN